MDSGEKQKGEALSSTGNASGPDGGFHKISDLFKAVNDTANGSSGAPADNVPAPDRNTAAQHTPPKTGQPPVKRAGEEIAPPQPLRVPRKEDILLDKNALEPRTALRDPLFAAHVLRQEQEAGKQSAADAAPVPRQPQAPPPAPPEAPSIKALRTYQGDVAEALKKQKTSVIQMVLAEHDRKEKNREALSPTSKKNLPLVAVSIFFVVLSILLIGGGGLYYAAKQKNISGAPKAVEVPSLVFAETKKGIEITGLSRDRIINEVSAEITGANLRLDFIEHIYFAERLDPSAPRDENNALRLVGTDTFLRAIESKMPNTLSRSLEPLFMLGTHAFNGTEAFLILKTSFFENAFAGMLRWEEFMARELLPLFASSASKSVYDSGFEDLVFKNRDLRVLRDETGEIILLYSFYDNATIVISTSLDTLDEVVMRLNRPKAQ